MRISALLLLSLLPASGMAYPAMGDFTRHEAEYRGFPVIQERRILSHDADSDTFEVNTRSTYRGRVLEDVTRTLPRMFLYTHEKIADTLKHCAEREGAVSDIRLKGKILRSCEFYNEDSQLTTIVGPVPFGQIRYQIYLEGEEFLDFNLVDYAEGASLGAPGTSGTAGK